VLAYPYKVVVPFEELTDQRTFSILVSLVPSPGAQLGLIVGHTRQMEPFLTHDHVRAI